MSPLEKYQELLAAGQLKEDAQQALVIEKFTACYDALCNTKKSWLTKLKSPAPIKGFYLWGSVGIGKTALLDIFFNCLPCTKLRLHFFKFMRDIHQQLKIKQGQKNPLAIIAKEIASHYNVICFDEFFVSDIADAMVLGELFQHLLQAGITLIATSNTAPDDLYKNGLQRERFMPAIDAIKKYTEVIHLTSQKDYRLRHEKPTQTYLYPIDQDNKTKMQQFFDYYAHGSHSNSEPIELNTHRLNVIKKSRGVLFCNFKELCEADRSPKDYLDLASHFHTVLLEGLTQIPTHDRKTILRFIHLIDIFYDQHVRLIILADIELNEIYPQGPHHVEYARTQSRLIEMQSPYYVDRDDTVVT